MTYGYPVVFRRIQWGPAQFYKPAHGGYPTP